MEGAGVTNLSDALRMMAEQDPPDVNDLINDQVDGTPDEELREELRRTLRVLHGEREGCRATLAERDAERLRLVEALQRLADAADMVGVKFFDTDTMDEPVEEMQAAAQEARAALSDHGAT
jgi:hypothetical protein